jgi:hypothetical protein
MIEFLVLEVPLVGPVRCRHSLRHTGHAEDVVVSMLACTAQQGWTMYVHCTQNGLVLRTLYVRWPGVGYETYAKFAGCVRSSYATARWHRTYRTQSARPLVQIRMSACHNEPHGDWSGNQTWAGGHRTLVPSAPPNGTLKPCIISYISGKSPGHPALKEPVTAA